MNTFHMNPNQPFLFEPPLLAQGSGALNERWVHWYRSKTGATLPEALQAGVSRMLEIQQQMVGFFREYTQSRAELMAKYPDYSASPLDYTFFQTHLSSGNRYVASPGEPSPFYHAKGEGVENASPWQKWFMAIAASPLEGAVQREEELRGILTQQARITPETSVVHPYQLTPTGDLSLIALLWAADLQPEASLKELHILLSQGTPGGYAYGNVGGFGAHNAFGAGTPPGFGG